MEALSHIWQSHPRGRSSSYPTGSPQKLMELKAVEVARVSDTERLINCGVKFNAVRFVRVHLRRVDHCASVPPSHPRPTSRTRRSRSTNGSVEVDLDTRTLRPLTAVFDGSR